MHRMLTQRSKAICEIFTTLAYIGGIVHGQVIESSGTVSRVESPQQSKGITPLNDASSAFRSAQRLVDRKSPSSVTYEAIKATLFEDNTPYLAPQLIGRDLWRVTIDEFDVQLPSAPWAPSNRFIRVIDVLLDAKDGRLYKVRSRWPNNEPPISPEATAPMAADQMHRSGNEVYHGFPVDTPAITFVEALDAIYRGGGDVLTARQINADYVLWSRIGKWHDPRPVWAVTLRGISPVRPLPGSNEAPIHSFRYIVDAVTGKLLCGTTVPRYREDGSVTR